MVAASSAEKLLTVYQSAQSNIPEDLIITYSPPPQKKRLFSPPWSEFSTQTLKYVTAGLSVSHAMGTVGITDSYEYSLYFFRTHTKKLQCLFIPSVKYEQAYYSANLKKKIKSVM
jgi:hypothetical protein